MGKIMKMQDEDSIRKNIRDLKQIEMKGAIIKIICFIGIGLFLLRSISYCLRSDTLEKRCFAGYYALHKGEENVVFIGSSKTRSSMIPAMMGEQYGFTSYVLATSAQDPRALIHLLREAAKTQPQAVFVFDLAQFSRDDEVWDHSSEAYTRLTTDSLRYSVNRIMMIQDIVKEDRVSYYFDICKYHTLWKFGWQWDFWNLKEECAGRGYALLSKTEEMEYPSGKYTTEKEPVTDRAQAVLVDLLKECRDKHLKTEFICPPDPGGDYRRMNYLEEAVKSYGFDCINFNNKSFEHMYEFKYDFYDGGHTNVSGALKTSRYYGSYLHGKYHWRFSRNEEFLQTCKEQMIQIYETINTKVKEGTYDE